MKPKMQLSPGEYVTQAFRADMDKWLIDFFGYEEDAEITPVVEPKKTRKPRVQITKTLSSLLENIDKTFKALEFDIDGVTFNRMLKTEVIGLKKCSPLVTNNDFMNGGDTFLNKVDVSKGLPTYFVIAVNKGDQTNKDSLAPDFAFGMKVKKVPWNVTRMSGTVYLFGMAWRDGKKHIWMGFWLSVKSDGSIHVADELMDKHVSVHGGSYVQRVWEKSAWDAATTDKESAIRHCFCETLSRYQTRNDNWNIGVSNGKKRVSFLIPDNEAKTYFKDRVKVKTDTGKTKPIIHFVNAHTQQHGEKRVFIPEHIRGLREFDWNAYHCTITAPNFHAFKSNDFELYGEHQLGEDVPDGFIGIGELADKLNALEDSGMRKKA